MDEQTIRLWGKLVLSQYLAFLRQYGFTAGSDDHDDLRCSTSTCDTCRWAVDNVVCCICGHGAWSIGTQGLCSLPNALSKFQLWMPRTMHLCGRISDAAT